MVLGMKEFQGERSLFVGMSVSHFEDGEMEENDREMFIIKTTQVGEGNASSR